jgi:uncharacterized protein (DUF488 family)
MKIYTGNFANVKKYRGAGLHPISIAISARYFTGDLYRPLNPDRAFMKEPKLSYTPKYQKKLAILSPANVVSDLEKLSNGKDVILLCHEGEDDFCHRHLVADWLEQRLNIEVIELGKMQKAHQQITQPSMF